MSSGREKSVLATAATLLVEEDFVAVQVVVVPLLPLLLVEEGAGLNDEEAELTGDGSTEEAESMQRAESKELIEPSRLLDWTCAFIQGC